MGMGIGLVSGVVGIGGGCSPSLLIVSSLGTPKEAAATSALFIWLNSLAGILGSVTTSGLALEGWTIAPFAAAVFAGGWLGSKYGSKTASERRVSLILSAVLVVAASKRVHLALRCGFDQMPTVSEWPHWGYEQTILYRSLLGLGIVIIDPHMEH